MVNHLIGDFYLISILFCLPIFPYEKEKKRKEKERIRLFLDSHFLEISSCCHCGSANSNSIANQQRPKSTHVI